METITLEQMYYIGEMTGVTAVIASLIYLALQVQQNTKQLKTQGLKGAINEFVYAFSAATSDEYTTGLFRKGLNNFNALTKNEKGAFQTIMEHQLGGFNQVLLLHSNDLLSDSEFVAMERTFLAVFMCPGALEWWEDFKYLPPEELVSYVDKRIKEEHGKTKTVVDIYDCFKND